MANAQPQNIPIRLYQSEDHLVLAAPIPGMEPQDISIIIVGDRVTVQAKERGPRQEERDLLMAEWSVGPYFREIVLPQPVDADLSNATYGNGILVLSMLKLKPGQPVSRAEFRLEAVTSTFGERVGHSGRKNQPTTTQQHQQKIAHLAETEEK